jgi:hypothetical protein
LPNRNTVLEDFFALLNEPRRPWLDPEAVQARFLQLSAEIHPDRVHNRPSHEKLEANQRFATLNAACRCLQEPKDRLRHLVELERGAKLSQLERLPAAAMNFYFEIGRLCREVDQFLGEPPGETSPLFRLQRFERTAAWTEKLLHAQSALNARRRELDADAKALNPAWENAPPPGSTERRMSLPLDRLEQLYREFSYVSRWTGEVAEKLVQLSL